MPSEDSPSSFDDLAEAEDSSIGGNPAANADNFLVCVFNVSSKVSYSILQVAKTSTAKDVIVQALSKSRKDSSVEGARRPDQYVLVEETDSIGIDWSL
jgi:hypothetical protein